MNFSHQSFKINKKWTILVPLNVGSWLGGPISNEFRKGGRGQHDCSIWWQKATAATIIAQAKYREALNHRAGVEKIDIKNRTLLCSITGIFHYLLVEA